MSLIGFSDWDRQAAQFEALIVALKASTVAGFATEFGTNLQTALDAIRNSQTVADAAKRLNGERLRGADGK